MELASAFEVLPQQTDEFKHPVPGLPRLTFISSPSAIQLLRTTRHSVGSTHHSNIYIYQISKPDKKIIFLNLFFFGGFLLLICIFKICIALFYNYYNLCVLCPEYVYVFFLKYDFKNFPCIWLNHSCYKFPSIFFY